ncbi:MAG TPA: hypothetical protein VIL74_01955 [Pyrinomonadaceae bacterium]|jgi:hypothetical protein
MIIAQMLFSRIFVVLLIAAAVSAQTLDYAETEAAATKTLLVKDLRQAIREAENASATDLKSLLWRLTLYRRAAQTEKIVETARRVIAHPDYEKNKYYANGFLSAAIGSAYFNDVKIVWQYLENAHFDPFVYERLVKLCASDKAACDVGAVDEWLARKASEEETNYSPERIMPGLEWTHRRIAWRSQFGLDAGAIKNGFFEAVRKNPADLGAARRYLAFFGTAADIEQLAEIFSSPLAYDHYKLAEHIGRIPNSLPPNAEDAPRLRRVAVRLLLKSLALPFTENDGKKVGGALYCCVSVPSTKRYDLEKQLRFWTKKELAENYNLLGEPQNAQPLVEELAKVDKSDISGDDSNRLAGAVQAGSGARAVESEILRRQALRADSYEYWDERIQYYEGRDEPELVFNSYMQAFAAIPYDSSNGRSADRRLFFIRHFADFVDYKFGGSANEPADEEWSAETKRKHQIWKEAESFLRAEFEKTKTNLYYSSELLDEIFANDFDNLGDELLSKDPEILIRLAKSDSIGEFDSLLQVFLENKNIPDAIKDRIFGELIKIADRRGIESAWAMFDAMYGENAKKYVPQFLPTLEKRFAESREFVKTYKPSDDGADYRNLPNKYAEVLFKIYLAENNRRAAAKLVADGYCEHYSGMKTLIESAVRAGAFDEALRYWRTMVNLDRQYADNLDYLKTFPAFAKLLREFYAQMKRDEPDSAIPDDVLSRL